jgi:hypothetical protein
MSNVPSSPKVEQIIWFENHLPQWSATPTQFGTTAAQISALDSAVKAARQAYNAAQAARQAAKNATVGQDQQLRAMLTIGRDTVNLMKAFIANANNPALWQAAGLTPNASPSERPSPVAPYKLTAGPNSVGDVILKWKASQPEGVSGVIYSIRRAIDNGAFALLDSVGGKEFTDETVPLGTRTVTYAVKAKHGQETSDWSEALTLRFGRVGPGETRTIESTETTPVKLAA